MEIFEYQMGLHKMDEILDTLIAEIGKDAPMAEQERRMEALERQMIDIQTHAERR